MSRLFVDVDGTLLLWEKKEYCKHEHLRYGDKRHWRPNERLIAFVREWKGITPESGVTIWSKNGDAYASKWGKLLLPGLYFDACKKSRILSSPAGVYIDDHPERWMGYVLSPHSLGSIRRG